MRFRAWLNNAMQGRYGSDEFSRFLLPFGFVLYLAGYIMTRKIEEGAWLTVGNILFWIGFAAIFYNLFRTWSRKLDARRRENEKFLALKNRLLRRGPKRDYKNYRYFHCPACNKMVRVPKGKGTIRIKCPDCGEAFVRKS